MDIYRRSRLWLGSTLLLLCLLIQPIGVGAQCMTSTITTGLGTQAGMNYKYAIKYLSGTYSCMFVMSMSALGCDTSGTATSTMALVASAFTTAPSPTCSWNCDCGPVTIVRAELPVELMEFSIEG